MKSVLKFTVAAAAVVAGLASAASAQVQEVVVSAERRQESIQDVPLAVTAFSPEDLEAKQIDEPLDLIDYTPNTYGSNNTGLGSANVYYIRGLGNTESIATFDPPVGTYVDEIYIARQNGNNVSFFDVEQIEVLRGPQGTLFGRNTTGGAVIVRMRKPSEEFGGYAEVGYGSFDRQTARASVDLPISEMLQTKITGFWVSDDGYVDNIVTGETLNGQQAYGVRGDIRIKFGEKVTWDVSGDYVSDDTTNILNYVEGFTGLVKSGDSGRRISRTGIRKERIGDDLFAEALAGRGLGAEQKSFSFTSNLGVVSDIGDFNLIVGYYSLDQEFVLDFFDGGLGGQGYRFGGFTIANDGSHNSVSVELKYTKSFFDGFADVIGGVYYFQERNETDFTDILGSGPAPGAPITLADRVLKNDLDSIAVYAQGDFHLTEKLTFTAGARWTQETKSIDFVDQRAPGVGVAAQRLDSALILAQGIPLSDQKALVTPRFVLAYDFTDAISVFASATKGFKSGGWNARGTRADRIQPFGRESAWSYEAGLRSQLFDNVLRFNLTGFWLDVQDFQVPSAFVDGIGSIQFITQNFADLRNKGVEIEATFAPTEALDLYAAIGVQDAEYRNVDPSILAQATECLTNPARGGLGIVAPNCSISEPVRVPDFSLTLGAAYEFAIPGTGFSFTPSVNARHAGSTFTGTSNLANSFEDGFWQINAGVIIASDKNGLQFSAECTNCNNTIYVQSNLPPTVYINEPRRWGVKLRYRF